MSDNPHYNGVRHRTWAAKVLRRAGYRCEECRRYGRTDKDGLPVRATVAHHIQHLDEHPELAYDLANGRALCEACHNKNAPRKGRKIGAFPARQAHGLKQSPRARVVEGGGTVTGRGRFFPLRADFQSFAGGGRLWRRITRWLCGKA